MIRYIFFVALLAILPSKSFSEGCVEKVIDIAKVEKGSYRTYKVGEVEIVIYQRNDDEIQRAKNEHNYKFDNNRPSWWPIAKHPITNDINSNTTRSINDRYFVFWRQSPVYGYFVNYIPKKSKKGAQDDEDLAYLGDDWGGGFVDLTNRIGYDSTGRPVAIDSSIQRNKGGDLIYLNLLVPSHRFLANNLIEIECK